jgi:CheY-like chemotaxis protein
VVLAASLMPTSGTPGIVPILFDPDRGGAPAVRGTDALVVEDDESAVDIAEGLMRMLGYRTRVALDGHAALVQISTRIPDFILLDIHLPEMDGITFLKVLRKVREARDVPVVAVSAVYPPDGPVSRMLEGLGVSQYLSKPFNLAGLRAAISTAHPDGPLAPKPVDSDPTSRRVTSGPFPEWGIPCTGWIGGEAVQLIVEGAGPESVTVLAAPGAFRPGVTCRLECTVRMVVQDAMTETKVRLLARATGTVGKKAVSERWNLQVQAARPASGMALLAQALAG